MKRRSVLAVMAACATLLLTACGSTDRTRYRMTVEVETPEGVKSGSAVREITHRVPAPLPALTESKPQWRVKGEAVAVDLPGGQTLFALLTGEDGVVDFGGRDVWHLFRQLSPVQTIELWPGLVFTDSPRITNPRPMLVHFRDIYDPISVEKVDPDDLSASFGKGVTLKRITVQLTDDAVTTGIEKRLGWLAASADGGLDPMMGVTAQPTLAQRLGFQDFRRK